jgi:hypothetical protein
MLDLILTPLKGKTMLRIWKRVVFAGLCLLITFPAISSWSEFSPVLAIKCSIALSNLREESFSELNFQLECIDKDGNFIFINHARMPTSITILNSKMELVRHIPYPMPFEEKYLWQRWPDAVHVLGDSKRLLVHSDYANEQWCVFDYEGRLLNLIYSKGPPHNLIVYPDGRFILYFHDESTERIPPWNKTGHEYFSYLLYDPNGNLLEILNRPPPAQGWHQRLKDTKKVTIEVAFPDKRYLLYPPDEPIWSDYRLYLGGYPIRDRTGGFFLSGFDGYSHLFNSNTPIRCDPQGRIIGKIDYSSLSRLESQNKAPNYHLNAHGALDQSFNLYTTFASDVGLYLCRADWKEGIEFSPTLDIEPLDGYFMPFNAPAKRKGPLSIKIEAGAELAFEFPEQEIPLDGSPHPVYSLWQYQVSGYQDKNPGAFLGAFTSKASLWNATVDLSLVNQGKVSETVGWPGGMKTFTFEGKQCWWWSQLEYLPNCYFCYDKENSGILNIYFEGQQAILLDPDKPDVLRMKPYDCRVCPGGRSYTFLYETGKDTKVFITPSFWTCLLLTPKNLEEGHAATIRVHSRVWPDKKDTLTLSETTPGSRIFTNREGTIIYELAFVMDEHKNLVARPDPSTINYLYFYITDPLLGLNRAPQIVGETGVDKGEYRAWGELPGEYFNYQGNGPWICKPWRQVEREIKQSQFTVKASGPGVKAGSVLRVTWDEPGKGLAHADIPLAGSEKEGFKTTKPILCFTLTGCDIDGTWQDSDNIPTPQIPGAVTFRDKNVKWEVGSSVP